MSPFVKVQAYITHRKGISEIFCLEFGISRVVPDDCLIVFSLYQVETCKIGAGDSQFTNLKTQQCFWVTGENTRYMVLVVSYITTWQKKVIHGTCEANVPF